MTVHVVSLRNSAEVFHSWWSNFYEMVKYKHRLSQSWYSVSTFDRELRPWNAKLVNGAGYLEFKEEKDATMFFLRWS